MRMQTEGLVDLSARYSVADTIDTFNGNLSMSKAASKIGRFSRKKHLGKIRLISLYLVSKCRTEICDANK